MGLKLYFSNGLERLGRQLAENIRLEQGDKKNVFDPDIVIVPNPNVEKWLKLKIADQNQIAFNINFLFLETGLWKTLEMLNPDSLEHVQLLSRKQLQLMLMGRHLTFNYSRAELKPIRDYLNISEERLDDAGFIKMWQLSEQLSAVFLEYEYHRSAMISSWLQPDVKPQTGFGITESSDIALYQARLFHTIFGEKGLLDDLAKERPRYMTLCQYTHVVLAQLEKKPLKPLGKLPRIHLFGHSQLSPFHRDLLVRISRWLNIRMYHLNVCSEFWEDMSTPAEDRWRRLRETAVMENPEGEYLEEDEFENELLKMWGRPGRETLRLLSEIEDQCTGWAEFESHWLLCEGVAENDEPNVLETIQTQILNRTAVNPQLYQDKSLQIAACPGIYREVETVYHSIVRNLSENPQLTLNDIAVLVPDMDQYGPVLTSVFTKGRQLPFSLIDANAVHESVYGQAVKVLLRILSGEVTRKNVLALMFNPCFREKFNLSYNECMTWLEWVTQLNIFRGFTSVTDESPEPLQNGPFSWLQGLRRLRFGRIMDIPDSDPDSGSFLDYNGIVPYQHMLSMDTKSVSKLCHILETLHTVASPLATRWFSCGAWKEKLDYLLDFFLTVPKNLTAEETVQRSLAESLARMVLLDDVTGVRKKAADVPVSWVKTYIENELSAISSSRGGYLTSGVSIASLHPMRPIPFSIVYVLGLGEGQFPRSDVGSSLNLIKHQRKIGDVSKLEADCYLFLETLSAVREKLYLSYVSLDLQQDAELYPGSIVKQLMAYVTGHVLTPAAPFKETRIPLKGSSLAYIRSEETAITHTDLYFNASPSDRALMLLDLKNEIQGRGKRDDNTALEKEISAEIGGFLERPPTVFQVGEETVPEIDYKDQRVTLNALTAFLKNPAEGTLQRHANLWEEKADDAVTLEDERFFRDFPVSWNIPKQIVQHGVLLGKTGDALKDYIEAYYNHLLLKSEVPAGPFGAADLMTYQIEMGERFNRRFMKDLSELNQKKCFRNVTFGENRNPGVADIVFPPVELYIDPLGEANAPKKQLRVEIHGNIPLVWGTDENNFSDTMVILNLSSHPKQASRHTINVFLFYVLAALTGKVKPDDVFTVHVSRKADKDHGRTIYNYSGMDPKAAEEYLKLLVQDYLFTASVDMLPFDILTQRDNLKAFLDPEMDNDVFAKLIRTDIEDYKLSFSRFSREIPDILKLAEAELPNDALHIVRRRLGPIFTYQVD